MTVFNGAMNGGVELLFDRETRFLDCLLAAPIFRISMASSRFIYMIVLGTAQSFLLILTAYIFGVRFVTGIPGILFTLLVGILLEAGISQLSIALAMTLKTHNEFFTLLTFLVLPVTFLSTALFPMELMPPWIAFLVQFKPLTFAIEATRSLVLFGWDFPLLSRMIGLLLVFNLRKFHNSIFLAKKKEIS